MNDPIADLITRIKTSSTAGKDSFTVPFSNLRLSILEALEKGGYIGSITKKGKKTTKALEIVLLKKANGEPVISNIERVSKLSKRVYIKAKDVKPFKSGFGHVFLTTPKGILVDKEAKKENVGGEVLFKMW